jgi:outer membrane protein TolC
MFYYRNNVRSLRSKVAGAAPVLLLLAVLPFNARAALDVTEAVRLALADDPGIAAGEARAQAFSNDAVADGQLPDPRLKTGIYNLPADDLDINREPTTQWRVGIEQAFPRGRSLQYRQRHKEWLASAEQAAAEDTARQLVRDVRERFLELYYQEQAGGIVAATRSLFAQLVEITRAHYASGRVSQQDVLRAALELSRLDDRATRIRNESDRQRAALGKWIGDAATLPLAAVFPQLPALPAKQDLEAAITRHPLIREESARLQASNQSVQVAREQYKPGWSAGVEYRKRFGDDPGGSARSDMLAAMVSVELPLFTASRQDRRLAASIQQAGARQLTRDDRLRELKQQLGSDYADWQRLGERAALYETRLLKEAAANVQASLKAYQSGVTEFTTLMRARISDLDARLDELRIRVDRAIAHASLLYLAGDDQ